MKEITYHPENIEYREYPYRYYSQFKLPSKFAKTQKNNFRYVVGSLFILATFANTLLYSTFSAFATRLVSVNF